MTSSIRMPEQEPDLRVIGKIGCPVYEKLKVAFELLSVRFPKSKLVHEGYLFNVYDNKIREISQASCELSLQSVDPTKSPLVLRKGMHVPNVSSVFESLSKEFDYTDPNPLSAYEKMANTSLNIATNDPNKEYAFMDLYIHAEGGESKFQLIFELYKDVLPRTVENFCCICQGMDSPSGNSLCYKDSLMHMIKKSGYIVGGDVLAGDGSSGESIYGDSFEDESFHFKHDVPGRIGMVSGKSKHSNTSQFYITFKKLQEFDGKFVVFGTLLKGFEALKFIDDHLTSAEDSIPQIQITDCGIYEGFKPRHLPPPCKKSPFKLG